MTLEIVETFLTIGSTKANHPVVFRYSLHYGDSRIDVAHLKTDVFDHPAHGANWNWIPEKADCADPERQTHWSMLVSSICDFANIGMFAPKAVKAKGQIFATFSDFEDSIAHMLNKEAYLKALFADDVVAPVPVEAEHAPITLPVQISDDLFIDKIAFGDEHTPVETFRETAYYRYVYMDVTFEGVVFPELMVSADLYFENVIFDHKESPWAFIQNPDHTTNVPNDRLVAYLEANRTKVQAVLKNVFVCETDLQK